MEIQAIQELESILWDNKIVAWNTVAACCVLLYDVLLTVGDEINYIWRSSWSFVKALHIVIRYFSLFYLCIGFYASINTHLSVKFCRLQYPFGIWASAVLVPAIDILILSRIYALYNRNIKMAVLLVTMWIVETVTIIVFVAQGLGSPAVQANKIPGVLPGCFPVKPFTSTIIIRSASSVIAIQGIYLGLSLYILFRRVRAFRLLTSMTPMLRVFFRDGAMYCLIICIVYLANILSVTYADGTPLEQIGEIWLVPAVSISAGRLVLNLRGSVTSSDTREDTKHESTEMDVFTEQNGQIGQFSSVIVVDNMDTRNSYTTASSIA